MTRVLLTHQEMAATDIFGSLDAMKVRSCMTLFDAVSPDDIFEQDYALAVSVYTSAAEEGNATAINNLGWLYHKGLGVKRQ